MIRWPAIIKLADDDELIYVADHSAWQADRDLHDCACGDDDRLVDAAGSVYTLGQRDGHAVLPAATGRVMPLPDILSLVKAHAARKGSCCVAKLHAGSIAEAFAIVAALEDA